MVTADGFKLNHEVNRMNKPSQLFNEWAMIIGPGILILALWALATTVF
jgi:hypothetical protein